MFKKHGFTIVELIVAIVVIAILASIVVVSYNGYQQRAAVAAMLNDLDAASAVVENYALKNNGQWPGNSYLQTQVKTSPNVALAINLPGSGTYVGLSSVQNGVLMEKVCDDLIAEGYGKGLNASGQMTQYITGCTVNNLNLLKVDSTWSGLGRNQITPVASNSLPDTVAAINYNDPANPNWDTVEKTFFQKWNDRFLEQGGTYPVNSFYNPSCGNGNGCVHYESLPPMQPPSNNSYCILATYSNFSTLKYRITSDKTTAESGDCS